MKAKDHARVWQDVTATLRTTAVIETAKANRARLVNQSAPGFTEMKARRTMTLMSGIAEFTEIVAAAYREEAERDGE